jgi:hypothetical protein
MRAQTATLVAMLVLFPAMARAADDLGPMYDVPHMNEIIVDGRANDWGDGGFRIDILIEPGRPPKAVQDHDARVRLGWNNNGFLVLATVRDNKWCEHPDVGVLWAMDAIEVFLSPRQGEANVLQWVIAPGMDPERQTLRWELHDHRTDGRVCPDDRGRPLPHHRQVQRPCEDSNRPGQS